jgi:hypothetical protein
MYIVWNITLLHIINVQQFATYPIEEGHLDKQE